MISPLCFLNTQTGEEKPQIKLNSLNEENPGYQIHIWSDKAFKDTVVNWTLPLLPGFTLTLLLTGSTDVILCIRKFNIIFQFKQSLTFSPFLMEEKNNSFFYVVKCYFPWILDIESSVP